MRKESKVFTKQNKYPSRHNIGQHKQVKHRIQKLFSQEYWAYINGILFPAANEAKDSNENKKTLWNYVKHCKKDSIYVAPLRNPSTGILESEPIGKAQLLNEQFKSVLARSHPCAWNISQKMSYGR